MLCDFFDQFMLEWEEKRNLQNEDFFYLEFEILSNQNYLRLNPPNLNCPCNQHLLEIKEEEEEKE